MYQAILRTLVHNVQRRFSPRELAAIIFNQQRGFMRTADGLAERLHRSFAFAFEHLKVVQRLHHADFTDGHNHKTLALGGKRQGHHVIASGFLNQSLGGDTQQLFRTFSEIKFV